VSRFFDWTPDDAPAVIIDTSSPAGWEQIRQQYAPAGTVKPLERLIEVAMAHGVSTVVVERRYIDADYRSEHSRFYSTTFRRYPSVCHRLHFFTRDVPGDLRDLGELQDHYIGYSVMRPFEQAPVGRTVVAPPPELAGATLCLATDEVHLFGWRLTARGVPFTSQDAQYLRCAHSAEWMVLYHAHLVHGLPRRLPSDIHDAAMNGEVVDRQLPSMGLSLGQMLSSLQSFALSPGRLLLPESRDDSKDAGPLLSLPAILCRYVNSQMPPIVVSPEHAWVIVGYSSDGSGHDGVTLYRHDDSAGPYLEVPDPWGEPLPQHRPWLVALPPLPQKCYLSAERAEALGSLWLRAAAANAASAASAPGSEGLGDDVTVRTYAIKSSDYKQDLAKRSLPDAIAQMYRLASWPKYIWVVEAIDRAKRSNGDPCVLGEVILDATAHHLASATDITALLSFNLRGSCVLQTPDHREIRRVTVGNWKAYESGCPAATS
jgi:hypothetical protein